MLQKHPQKAEYESGIPKSYAFYVLFLLILLIQAAFPQMDFRGFLFVGMFTEPFFMGLFFMALEGIIGLVIVLPVLFIYYALLIQVILLVSRSRVWVACLLLLPPLIATSVREYNLEYERAYYHTYRDATSNDVCKNTDRLHTYICKKVVARNIHQKSDVEYCKTLGMDYSYCIRDIAIFKKDISVCRFLNQDIALPYTKSSTPPYLRDCVKDFVAMGNVSLEQACDIFTVAVDYNECLDVFVDKTKNWSLCDQMKEQSAVKRCKYYRDEYLNAQK